MSSSTCTYTVKSQSSDLYAMPEPYKLGEKGSGFRQYCEVQDFYKLRDQCLAEGRLFEDPAFEPIDSNIFYSRKLPKPFKWKRPTELVSDPHFFVEGISRFDVVQGELGNCWLLAAVANLTLNATLFQRVVPDDQGFHPTQKYAGIFHFRFWQYGKWVDVVVDDRLPTREKLVFLHSRDQNEFWSALLEKAYAKLHGSYEALKGGKACEAMADFSGGLTETYSLQSPPPNLFTIMVKAHERSSLMSCSITTLGKNETEFKLPNGLIVGHAYSITDIKLVDLKTPGVAEKIQLLRVRNPWGNDHEWNGAWSDNSREWQLIPAEERDQLGLVFDADGEFWMSFSDFVKNFHDLEICNLGPDVFEDDEHSDHKHWECKSFDGSWMKGSTAGGCRNFIETFPYNPQYRIQLEDSDEADDDNSCTLIVALMQKHRRLQRKMGLDTLSIGFVIYYLKNPDSLPRPLPRQFFEYTNVIANVDSFTNMREVSQRFKLPPGIYCIVPSTYDPNDEGEFLLRVYSEKKNKMSENDEDVSMTDADANVVKDVSEDHNKANKLNIAFCKIAGEDQEVDANQLKYVLDSVLKKEFDFPGFGINLCRGMVAIMDVDYSGKLGFEEFKQLFLNIATWKRVFKMYDKNNSGTLNSFELRAALASAGYHVNIHILQVLTLRYANQNNEVSFEDFIMCAIKLKTMIEAFKKKDTKSLNEATFKLDEWLTLTMYA